MKKIIRLFFFVFIFLLLIFVSSRRVLAETVEILPVDDTEISNEFDDTEHGSLDYYRVRSGTDDNDPILALIKFYLTRIPQGSTINRAILKQYVYRITGGSACTVKLDRITTEWSENTITEDNSDSLGAQSLNYIYMVGRTGFHEWDITPTVRKWYKHEYPNEGLTMGYVMAPPAECRFISKDVRADDQKSKRPRLVVDYTPPEVVIRTVSPAGIVVRLTSPTPTPTPTPTIRIIDFGSLNINTRNLVLPQTTTGSLKIENIDIQPITDITANFNWKTTLNGESHEGSSYVYLSTTADDNTPLGDYPFKFYKDDWVVQHAVKAEGLGAGITYSFRIYSNDGAGNEGTSSRGTFTTLSSPLGNPAEAGSQQEQMPAPTAGEETKEGATASKVQQPGFAVTPTLAAPIVKGDFNDVLFNLFDQIKGSPAKSFWPIVTGAIIVAAIVLVLIIKKKHNKNTHIAKESEDSKEEKKRPSLIKIILIIIGLIVGLNILQSAVVFLPVLLRREPANILPSLPPAPQLLKYSDVPEEFKNIKVDCENDRSFIPSYLRESSFYCQNVYNAQESALADFEKSKASRLIFYGENTYFECPVFLGASQTLINRCINTSLFLDYWQMKKTSELMGIPALTDKLYLKHAEDEEELKNVCKTDGASECYNSEDKMVLLYQVSRLEDFQPEGYSNASMYEGLNKEIQYSYDLKYPPNCFDVDLHEMGHYFNAQYFGRGALPAWFEEGIVRLLYFPIQTQLCPLGIKYSNISRTEGGKTDKLTNFDPVSLDLEEPLQAGLESYAKDNTCRKAIYKEIARYVSEEGLNLIPSFYFEMKQQGGYSENDIARALYKAEKSPESLKIYFSQNSCSL